MNSKIIIPICRPSLPSMTRYCDSLEKVWESRMLSNFSYYALRMEHVTSKYLRTKNVVIVSSGDLGLILALSVLKILPGSEVILPSFTFNSTANAVVWNRLKPVFADIDKETLCLDPKDVARKVTRKTKVIIGTHVFGNPCEANALNKIAGKAGVYLIFDAAAAYGSRYKAKEVGTLADVEVFSFSGTKVVTSAEGGLIVARSKKLAAELEYARNYGFSDDYQSQMLGINGKISEFNAALGCATLPKIDRYVNLRNRIARIYKSQLAGVGDIRFQSVRKGNVSNYKDFCILTTRRDELSDYLMEEGIQTKKYFYPLHKMPYFLKYKASLPTTELVANQILCLPIYNAMTDSQVEYVCERIKTFYEMA